LDSLSGPLAEIRHSQILVMLVARAGIVPAGSRGA
jgi:hypothetical protein